MATIKTVDAGNKDADKIEIDDTILETPYHKKSCFRSCAPVSGCKSTGDTFY